MAGCFLRAGAQFVTDILCKSVLDKENYNTGYTNRDVICPVAGVIVRMFIIEPRATNKNNDQYSYNIDEFKEYNARALASVAFSQAADYFMEDDYATIMSSKASVIGDAVGKFIDDMLL
jgi:hypothetical protein